MLHSRFTRFNSAKKSRNSAKKNRNHRNLDNLHVISTESVVGLKPAKLDPLLSAPPQEYLSTVQPVVQESQYNWYNPDCVNTIVCPSEEKNETTECTVETPVEESYFEEVEVASYEADGAHEIPVGFRKSKIHYLKYKRNCFFKPKIYNIGAQRTIVNCLNIQNSSPDIDVVSEAEYEIDCETDKSEKGESGEELHTFIEENEKCELEACEQIGDSLCTEEKNFTSKSGIRNYNSSIKNDEFDLYQGKSLNQSSLDSWKSHLIGLEYLLEIRHESKDSVMKYLCVLCNVELEVEGFPSICVINHINGYKHMVKYLEKHFPACGYRFEENSNYDNNVILQKLCDVINRNLGYNFMCITSLAQYVNNKQKIVDIILNAHHFNGDSLQLENELLKTVDVILLDEVSDVLKDIIEQITPKDTDSSEQLIQSIHEKLGKGSNSQLCLENAGSQRIKSKCSELSEDTNSLNVPKPPARGKRSKSLSSYLKLTHARARLTKPKALSDTLKGHQVKETPSENIVSEQKGGSNNISESKTVKECKLDVFEHKGGSNNISESKTVKECKLDVFEQKAGSNNISESKTVKECQLNFVEQKACGSNISESKTVKECKLDVFEQKSGSSNISESKAVKESELISKQKPRSDISESKTVKEYEVDDVTTEEDKFEITMTLREDKARIIKPTKTPKIIRPDARQRLLYKIKEKALQKQTTMHSKHCRKRILGKENSRLRVTVKSREKSESVSDIISKTSAQYQSVASRSASERIVSEKKRENKIEELQHLSSKTTGSSSYKLKSPLRKVSAVPVHKTKIGSKSIVKGQPIATLSVRPKIIHKCSEKSKSPINVQVRDFHSHKKITKVSRSKSPIKRIIRRHSKSPVRKIKSPLRLVRSPVRKSPIRKIKSPLRLVRSPVRKSPVRRHSRSPVRRRSRSPLRRLTRSPVRRRSRSPAKRHSRSPLRRHSRSPLRRRSKSPVRKQSRSPIRRYSRSPVRRFSRSPVRRYSRNSRSPVRRHSKSPSRRHSRSPGYRKSRSPHRRRSRTPLKRHSRSPLRRYSRSPVRKRSRSPLERLSRSPHHSPIKQYKSSYRGYSPIREHSRGIQGSINVHNRYSSPHKHYSMHDLSMNNKGNAISKNDKYKLYTRASGLNRDISDLDPVSDEDESVYFNTSDKRQHTEEPKISQNSRLMLAQLLQKFSVTDANANDPTLNKLMQFIESHSDELQEVMGSQYSSDKRNPLKVDANIQDRNLILQQYLLSNLAGSTQESLTTTSSFSGTSNVPSDFPGSPFVQDRAHSPYGLAPRGTIQDPLQSTHNQPRYFPPNLNVPPPEHFHQFSHVPHGLSPKPKVPPENMFKDLKATVSKLFGANESVKQEKNKPNVPAYVTVPDPEKWDLNHPNAPKFSVPGGPKDIFHSQGKSLDFHSIPGGSGMRGSMPVSYKNNSGPTHFFNSRGIDRQQLPNVPIPPPDTKVAFCDVPSTSSKGNLFPVVNNMQGNPTANTPGNVSDVKVSLAQRLASVLVKVGMIDVPAPLLQEMLMKIGAFSSCPPQDIRETEIVSILKRLGYLT